MIQSSDVGQAKTYFTDALLKTDYYINDQELKGHFAGRLAERIGLDSNATKDTFSRSMKTRTP